MPPAPVDTSGAEPGPTPDDTATRSADARPEAPDVALGATVAVGISGASSPAHDHERGRSAPLPAQGNGRPNGHGAGPTNGQDRGNGCTAPQLRRFIKSRVYVPMHELRRRFAINGEDDDVTPVDFATRRIFVGLPAAEGRLLGDLLRNGEVGYELSMDPTTPVVIGVYSMRPVSRS